MAVDELPLKGIPTFRNGTGRDGTIPEIVAKLLYGTGQNFCML